MMASPENHDQGWRAWRSRRLGRTAMTGVGAILLLAFALLQVWVAVRLTEHVEKLRADGFDLFDSFLPFRVINAIAIGALAIGAALAAQTALRDIRRVRRVTQTDGCVCPRCAIVMRLLDAEIPASDLDARRLRCHRCGLERSAGEIRSYWEQTVASPAWARRWRRELDAPAKRGSRLRGFSESARRHPIRFALAMVPAAIVGMVAVLALNGMSPAGIMLQVVPLAVLMLAVAVVVGTFSGALQPDDVRRCATCGYEQLRSGNGSPRCPECGADWLKLGGTTIGRRPSGRLLGVFCALIGAAMGTAFMLSGPILRTVQPLLPSTFLIAAIGDSSQRDRELVATLDGRSLDRAQRRQMLARLVDLRDNGHYLDDTIAALLDQAFLDGELDSHPGEELDADLRADFVVDSIAARIAGPERAQVGTAIRLVIEGDARSKPFPLVEVRFAFGGWRIAEGPPLRREDRVVPAIRLWPKGVQSRGFGPPELVYTPQAVGEIVITADLWIILDGPGTEPRRVGWNSDGAPLIADPPPLAMHRTTLTHRVRVE